MKNTLMRLEQSAKLAIPIVSVLLQMVMLVRPEQPEKPYSTMLVTFMGMVILASLWHE